MERLIQKYSKLFDIFVIMVILIQLLDAIITTLTGCIKCDSVISVFLSIINIILLINSLHCNHTQQFIEWKANAKILRYALGIFIIFRMIVCIMRGFNVLELGSHLMNLVTIEIVLSYRITSIRHLEELANRYAKEKRR